MGNEPADGINALTISCCEIGEPHPRRRSAWGKSCLPPHNFSVSRFNSVFAPPAGLERATGRLTRPSMSLIEDNILLMFLWCDRPTKFTEDRSSSPIRNLALAAVVRRFATGPRIAPACNPSQAMCPDRLA